MEKQMLNILFFDAQRGWVRDTVEVEPNTPDEPKELKNAAESIGAESVLPTK